MAHLRQLGAVHSYLSQTQSENPDEAWALIEYMTTDRKHSLNTSKRLLALSEHHHV
ncbi:hypothetical protein O9992_22235 [Vibrio lentus]|nr:hypothetical protein [Vibrio lentus]